MSPLRKVKMEVTCNHREMPRFKNNLFFVLLSFSSCISRAQQTGQVNPDKEVVCLVYHRIGDNRYPSTNTTTINFEAHLKYLTREGFQVLGFTDAINYLKSEGPTQKTAVVTIDDGFKSFYEHGFPLLKKYGVPATLFINTGTVGAPSYMNWSQLKELSNAGIEIGNHTHTHAYFLNQPEPERYNNFKSELLLSQQLIHDHLGTYPTAFAYPYGELDAKMVAIVKEMGFTGAAAQNSGVIGSSTDLMRCPRFPMSETYSGMDQFQSKVNMHHPIVHEELPLDFIAKTGNPELELTISKDSPLAGSVNCFIQGAPCEVEQVEYDQHIVLTISPASTIHHRRRFLYTLTAQQNGQWYWYSHLWINPNAD